MKTRFAPLVKLKNNSMQKSEQLLQKANLNLNSASAALESSYDSLKKTKMPTSGAMSDMIASRALLQFQRETIKHNKERVVFAQNQVSQAKNQLKADMMEHEKFQYLELQEIKKMLKEKNHKEAKYLDEIAFLTYGIKGSK